MSTSGMGGRQAIRAKIAKNCRAFAFMNKHNPVSHLLRDLRNKYPGDEFVPLYDGTNRVKCVRTGEIHG